MCVSFSYISVVGDVLGLLLDGMSVLRNLDCCLGSCCVRSICSVISCLLACLMSLLSLFLYLVCRLMFSGVGFLIRSWCNLCCSCIRRANFGVVHGCLRGLGFVSYFSMLRCMVVWISRKRCEVVVCGVCVFKMCVIAVWIVESICNLFLSYLLLESVFLESCWCVGTASWKIVNVGM